MLVSSLVLTAAALCQTPLFTFGFEPVEPVYGSPGEVKTLEVYATLTTERNPEGIGAQGWSIAVKVEGGGFREIGMDGVVVDTLFDADRNPSTPLMEVPLDLGQAGFVQAHLESSLTPLADRAGAAVVLNQAAVRTLLPEGTVRVARLTVEAAVPSGSQCLELKLRHTERSVPFKTGGFFRAAVAWKGMTVLPVLGTSTIRVCPPPVYVRCDPNRDGRSDAADAVWILNQLFQGGPASRCPEAADCDGDGGRDITDALYSLAFQFLGGPPPPAPFPACGRIEGTTTPETCPEPPIRCPGE